MELDRGLVKKEEVGELGRVAYLPALGGKFRFFSHEIFTIERERTLVEEDRFVDVFGSGWLFFKATCKEGVLAILQDGKPVCLGAKVVGYAPSKSVIEWIIPKGEVHYEMLVCGVPLKQGVPDYPLSARYEDEDKNLIDLFEDFFDHMDSKVTQNLSRTTNPSQLSLRAQNWIHENWRSNFKLYDLAQKLNTSPSVLSRYFKDSFGMSPLKYVNQLRIVSSVRDLLESEHTISQISHNVGFGDPRQFNEHFRKIYPVRPSDFKQSKSKALK